MTDQQSESDATERSHHPDCPALWFTGHPERCRCIFLAVLDGRRPSTAGEEVSND